jgi:hypothetical protein
VANVNEACTPGQEALKHARRDQFAIRRRPPPAVIVARKILRSFASFNRETIRSKLIYMVAQDRFTESTRSAVDAQINRIAGNPKSLTAFRIRDALDRLQLRKMIPAADRAEGVIVSGWLNFVSPEELASIAIPNVVETAQTIRPRFAFELLGAEFGSPQSDSTADIIADQCRI